MDIQAMVDGLAARAQRERSKSQMTLGKMIEYFASLDPGKKVSGIHAPHSYRGYYCDLAFEPSNTDDTAGCLLALCRSCMGQTFEGYKGGDYDMGAQTPVWVANYGDTGKKIVGFDADGHVLTDDDE